MAAEGDAGARVVKAALGNLDRYISATQLGITLASLGLGWIGEPAFARLLEPLLAAIGITSPEVIHTISFIFAFVTISFLHIVVGELAPKSLAIRIDGTLENVPGDAGIASVIGPRVYIPARYLAETQLLVFGSRSEREEVESRRVHADFVWV